MQSSAANETAYCTGMRYGNGSRILLFLDHRWVRLQLTSSTEDTERLVAIPNVSIRYLFAIIAATDL